MNELRKLFAELKPKCRTKGQMQSFNELVKSFDSLEREKRENHKQSYVVGIDKTNKIIYFESVFGRPEDAKSTVLSWMKEDGIKTAKSKSFIDQREAYEYAKSLSKETSYKIDD